MTWIELSFLLSFTVERKLSLITKNDYSSTKALIRTNTIQGFIKMERLCKYNLGIESLNDHDVKKRFTIM